MVDWSFDDSGGTTTAKVNPRRRSNSSLRAKRRNTSNAQPTRSRRMDDGRIQKVVNGQVMYLRVRKVVRN